MMNKIIGLKNLLLFLVNILVFIYIIIGCERIESNTEPSVITIFPFSVTETTAILGGNVTDDGRSDITERRIYYSTNENAEITGSKVAIGTGTGRYSETVSGLTPGIQYFVKAFATNKSGFTALPGGYRDDSGPFLNMGGSGYW